MPQFELENVGPNGYTGLVRSRTPEEAVRSVLGTPDEPVRIESTRDFAGWFVVFVGEEASGRIRPHQRMQFRRA